MNPSNSFKSMTNEGFFSYIFNFSKAGPMAHPIIVHAVCKYLKETVQTGEPPDSGIEFINQKSWYKACAQLKEEFDAKYGPT